MAKIPKIKKPKVNKLITQRNKLAREAVEKINKKQFAEGVTLVSKANVINARIVDKFERWRE